MTKTYTDPDFYTGGIIPVVTEAEIRDPEFIRDVKNYTASLGIPWRKWRVFLTDFYRDAPFIFVNDKGKEVFLDMDAFETPSIDYWFREFVQPIPRGRRPVVRQEARARVAVLASLMRAHKRMQSR